MAKLQITRKAAYGYEILIDGEPIKLNVVAVDIHIDMDKVPTAVFTIPFFDGIEVDIDADVTYKEESVD